MVTMADEVVEDEGWQWPGGRFAGVVAQARGGAGSTLEYGKPLEGRSLTGAKSQSRGVNAPSPPKNSRGNLSIAADLLSRRNGSARQFAHCFSSRQRSGHARPWDRRASRRPTCFAPHAALVDWPVAQPTLRPADLLFLSQGASRHRACRDRQNKLQQPQQRTNRTSLEFDASRASDEMAKPGDDMRK